MIVIKDKNIANTVWFPRNIYTIGDDYILKIRDRGTNKEYDFTVTDRHIAAYGFYTFFIDFSAAEAGEYEYIITDSHNDVVGSGILRLNELDQENICYEPKFTYEIDE